MLSNCENTTSQCYDMYGARARTGAGFFQAPAKAPAKEVPRSRLPLNNAVRSMRRINGRQLSSSTASVQSSSKLAPATS